MLPLPRLRIALATLVLACAPLARASDDYQLGPDSQPQPGVPHGKVTALKRESKIFPHTTRDWWIYVPAQYDGTKPACVMVFQDGAGMVKADGAWRTPTVFDNLIARKEMPVTIGVFIDPGVFPGERDAKGAPRRNRSFEYDTLSDQYTRFLLEEILPEVAKTYKLTDDPDGRAIMGSSSGGICSFTVAWQRPDRFRKVISTIGSYTSIAYRPAHDGQPMQPGGDLYPTLIRKNPIKPIKIFLQDGSNDLNNEHGNWHLANQQMLSALEWANANADQKQTPGPRYQVNHAWGDGGHTSKHAASILPDMLRWLWKDYSPKE